jgi:glycosyltransferase involved in cell wall biosynthesis
MIISIEVPVFKGQFLQQCINSVLKQSSNAWELSIVWDGGDLLSKKILDQVNSRGHPNIKIYFTKNQGIAKARAFLSNLNSHPYILPLDDDDELAPNAIELFIKTASENPWASLIRGRRGFINEKSEIVDEPQWFPFAPRNYYKGMVTDIFNQSQPYLIRRTAYEKTYGWRGFNDFMHAGEDCDIFLQLEELAHFELIDELLYYYRLHNDRASNELTSAAAFEMWRRLADESLIRMQLNLVRRNNNPPFVYEEKEKIVYTLQDVDFIVDNNSPLTQKLKNAGILSSSIIEVSRVNNHSNWRMEGFKISVKKLILFIDSSVEIQNIESLSKLVAALNESGADLMSPSYNSCISNSVECDFIERSWLIDICILAKREVLLATGGFDNEFLPENLSGIDFCIQARRKGFTCYEVNIPDIIYRQKPKLQWSIIELTPLKKKWRTHIGLLPSSRDLNRYSGEGARL